MKTYYGQMTKEQLLSTKVVVKDNKHNTAFQEMVYRAGCKWIAGDFGSHKYEKLLVVNEDGGLGFSSSTCWFVECEYAQINWLPESERPPTGLKSQLSEAVANRDKRKAKAQKATEKLEQAEAEVKRLISELEADVESIGGVSCNISEIAEPEIPDGVDVDDPKTWQNGDIVECVFSDYDGNWTIGSEYKFEKLDIDGDPMVIADNGGLDSDYREHLKLRFVRRP